MKKKILTMKNDIVYDKKKKLLLLRKRESTIRRPIENEDYP